MDIRQLTVVVVDAKRFEFMLFKTERVIELDGDSDNLNKFII